MCQVLVLLAAASLTSSCSSPQSCAGQSDARIEFPGVAGIHIGDEYLNLPAELRRRMESFAVLPDPGSGDAVSKLSDDKWGEVWLYWHDGRVVQSLATLFGNEVWVDKKTWLIEALEEPDEVLVRGPLEVLRWGGQCLDEVEDSAEGCSIPDRYQNKNLPFQGRKAPMVIAFRLGPADGDQQVTVVQASRLSEWSPLDLRLCWVD